MQLHEDIPIIRDFFQRLNSPLAPFKPTDFGKPKYYDFTDKVALSNHSRPTIENDYVAVLDKYHFLDDLNNLPDKVPDNVPEELLLTWPEFAEKQNLSSGSAEAGLLWPATPGNPLDTTALAIFNDGNHIEVAENTGEAVRSATHYNAKIYDNALAELKEHVLLESSIVAAQRGSSRKDGVRLVAKTPSGRKLIKAKQLMIAMPPVLDNTKYLASTSRNSPSSASSLGSTTCCEQYWARDGSRLHQRRPKHAVPRRQSSWSGRDCWCSFAGVLLLLVQLGRPADTGGNGGGHAKHHKVAAE